MCTVWLRSWWRWHHGLCLLWGDLWADHADVYGRSRYRRTRPPAPLPDAAQNRAELRKTQHHVD